MFLSLVVLGVLASACAKVDEGESPAVVAEPVASAEAEPIASTAEACGQLGGIGALKIVNQLDDDCGIWVNGAFAAPLPQSCESDWIPAPPSRLNRTNILVRCQDGGVYATSVEAVYQTCVFQLDEEGGGLRAVDCH
jgi:hypothetical protein